jgi:hypothetical protein
MYSKFFYLNIFESFTEGNLFRAGMCKKCEPNSYVNAEKNGCTICTDNSYVNAEKNGCIICTNNSYVNAEKNGCTICTDNSYVNAEKNGCTICTNNSYVNAEKNGCTICTDNSYVNAEKNGCTRCPDSSYVNAEKNGCTYKDNIYIYELSARENDELNERIGEMTIKNKSGWEECAIEDEYCNCPDGKVYYGFGNYFSEPRAGSRGCNNATFGDPYYGQKKNCYCDRNILSIGGGIDKYAGDFNDKIRSIRLPPNTKISYFQHGIGYSNGFLGSNSCYNLVNTTNKSVRKNVDLYMRNSITDIRYGKLCDERPVPKDRIY